MLEYIIHPYTKQVIRAENFQMFENWRTISFIEATGEEEIENENGDFELSVTLKDGTTHTSVITPELYFEGKSFYMGSMREVAVK